MTEGGAAGEYLIELADRTPLCLRHLPRKGGEGELCISLRKGERGIGSLSKVFVQRGLGSSMFEIPET